MDALAIAKHCEGKMLPVEATEVIFLKKIKNTRHSDCLTEKTNET